MPQLNSRKFALFVFIDYFLSPRRNIDGWDKIALKHPTNDSLLQQRKSSNYSKSQNYQVEHEKHDYYESSIK